MIGFIIGLVVGGLIIGALARLLMPGRDPMSLGMTMLLGIAGTLVGGLVGRALFGEDGGGFLLALICAMALLFVVRRTTHHGGHRIV